MLLKLADACFDVQGIPREWRRHVPDRFLGRVAPARDAALPVHRLSVAIEKLGHLAPTSNVVDFTAITRIVPTERGIDYVSVCCEGTMVVDSDRLHLQLVCHPRGYEWCASIIENALRVMVAYAVMQQGGFMVHSACVVSEGRAQLLVGHSGAGKSTCSRMAIEHGLDVISDDINVVLPAGSGAWKVVPVPFTGSGEAPPVSLPAAEEVSLERILELNQSRDNRISAVSPASAVASLYSCLPFINGDELRSGTFLGALTSLVRDVPFGRMDFRRDSGFLGLLRRAS